LYGPALRLTNLKGISFMSSKWDTIDWKTGSGMSKTGIGERAIPWPSHGGSSPFGGANPTCETCGGRLRGVKKCSCDEPAWVVDGESVEDGDGLGSTVALENVHAQQMWHLNWLKEAYRVLQPGGVIKAFSATRTFHRLAAAMVEAGFKDIHLEAWCYGSGFPKSLNIQKALQKQALRDGQTEITPEQQQLIDKFGGYGTALKPAWESLVVGKKP